METKFVVTTRREVIEQLKADSFYVIGVDGTAPNSKELYDELYDHHRPGGADIQILELPNYFPPRDRYAIVTTMVDADAICAAWWVTNYRDTSTVHRVLSEEEREFLEAISYDCDHLAVPEKYKKYEAAMVVAALKEDSKSLIKELNLSSNRREWSIEDKETFASKAFEKGVYTIDLLLKGEWDYKAIAVPYWKTVQQNVELIIRGDRISTYRDCLLFNARGLGGRYIDPRCWLLACERIGLNTKALKPITLTHRDVYIENNFKGVSYTLGCVPLHQELKDLDYTKTVFRNLTIAEKELDPNADGWGGRKTVGGSGWNTPSNLTPEQVIDIVL